MEAGVRQGVMPSPTLLSIFTANIPRQDCAVRHSMQAVQPSTGKSLHTDTATSKLQTVTDTITEWCTMWKIEIKAENPSIIGKQEKVENTAN